MKLWNFGISGVRVYKLTRYSESIKVPKFHIIFSVSDKIQTDIKNNSRMVSDENGRCLDGNKP